MSDVCEHGWIRINYVKCPRCGDKDRHEAQIAALRERYTDHLDAAVRAREAAEAEVTRERARAEEAERRLGMGGSLRDDERPVAKLLARALAAEAARDEALGALREAVSFAAEGWAYASPYFKEKWGYEETLKRLAARAASESPGRAP
jgi:hypothetical protein